MQTKLENIFLCSVQKTGSKWFKKIFSDVRLNKYTNLNVFPQHDYEYTEGFRKFPKYSLVPGLYISYQHYMLIEKPKNYKTIYIYRDPRNIVVSWFYSMLKTHYPRSGVNEVRERLELMSKEDGLLYSIQFLNEKFSFIRSWIELGKDDPNVYFVRFEEFSEDPLKHFINLLDFCNIEIPLSILKEILNEYSKDEMRKADLKLRKDKSESHYRMEKTNYASEFLDIHYQMFYNSTGNLIEVLGYDNN